MGYVSNQAVVKKSVLKDIANAIREKTGAEEELLPSMMAAGVRSIKGGGVYAVKVPESLPDEGVYACYQLFDKAINVLTLSTSKSVKMYMPAPLEGMDIRDFLVKLKVTSETLPSVQFVKHNDESSIGFEYEDEEWATVEAGINIFSFTETDKTEEA